LALNGKKARKLLCSPCATFDFTLNVA